ncbi:MAG: phosphotransferase enzyme family protein [Candidatus Thorarchaeota archaeon]|jgi:Ser/Thr protein kinase RdoA (MazF antagonist)
MSANCLSYRGFLLRLRSLAKVALEKYGLEGSELRFINYSGNGLYQVKVPSDRMNSDIPPGRYTLRLHQPDYMNTKYISSEMDWLSALNEAGIDVPRPFKNIEGQWIASADGEYDVPQARNCTLISWVDGRFVKKPRPMHFKSLGRLVGRMHDQSVHWKKPNGFRRPHWDWDGLYGEGFSYGAPAKDARDSIPKNHQAIFNDTLKRVQETSNQLGKGKKVYGLMHADLAISDNMVFQAGEARPFDFDDCGFGYWVFDLGVLLAHYMLDFDNPLPKMREALIEGYLQTSSLPESNLEFLDLFIAARLAQLMFFYQASALANPGNTEEANVEINNCAKLLNYVLKGIS